MLMVDFLDIVNEEDIEWRRSDIYEEKPVFCFMYLEQRLIQKYTLNYINDFVCAIYNKDWETVRKYWHLHLGDFPDEVVIEGDIFDSEGVIGYFNLTKEYLENVNIICEWGI